MGPQKVGFRPRTRPRINPFGYHPSNAKTIARAEWTVDTPSSVFACFSLILQVSKVVLPDGLVEQSDVELPFGGLLRIEH